MNREREIEKERAIPSGLTEEIEEEAW